MEFANQTTTDGATRLTLDGDLSIYHAVEIKQRLIDGIRAGTTLELDLSRVGEMDTAGFQLLALAKRESKKPATPCASSATARRYWKASSFSTWRHFWATRW